MYQDWFEKYDEIVNCNYDSNYDKRDVVMKLEEAIKILIEFKTKINEGKRILDKPAYFRKIEISIETVLRFLEESIPKSILREKINERQFELQQEYKDFKDDIRLNTLQEIYYMFEEN